MDLARNFLFSSYTLINWDVGLELRRFSFEFQIYLKVCMVELLNLPNFTTQLLFKLPTSRWINLHEKKNLYIIPTNYVSPCDV